VHECLPAGACTWRQATAPAQRERHGANLVGREADPYSEDCGLSAGLVVRDSAAAAVVSYCCAAWLRCGLPEELGQVGDCRLDGDFDQTKIMRRSYDCFRSVVT